MKLIHFLHLFLVFMFFTNLNGQELTWMPKNKLSKKDDIVGLSILGIKNDEIAIRTDKYFGFLDLNNLELKREYKLKMKGESILNIDDKWFSFKGKSNLFNKKEPFRIYYKQLDNDSKDEKILISIDYASNKAELKAIKKEMKKHNSAFFPILSTSKNKEWIILPWINYLNKTVNHIVFNKKLEKEYELNISYIQEINGTSVNLLNAYSHIQDDGNIIFSGYADPTNNEIFKPFVFFYDNSTDKISGYLSEGTKNIVNTKDKKLYTLNKKKHSESKNPITQLKTTKDQIIYAGLYKDKKGGGVFIGRFDLNKKVFIPFQEIAFNEELLTKIKTNNKGKVKSKLNGNLLLQDVLIKKNYDVTILFEIDGTDIQSMSIPGLPSSFSQLPQKKEYTEIGLDCRDILYFNFDNNNSLTYSGIIKKHQKKGNIKAASFISTTKENDTYILFNELNNSKGSSILSYCIKEDGSKTKMNLVLDNSKKQFIAPKKIDLYGINPWRSVWGAGLSFFLTKNEGELLMEGIDNKKSTLIKIQF